MVLEEAVTALVIGMRRPADTLCMSTIYIYFCTHLHDAMYYHQYQEWLVTAD